MYKISWTDSYSSCVFYLTTGMGRKALHYKQTDAAQGFFKKSRVAHIGQQIHLTRSLEESHFQRSSKSFLPVYLMDTGQQTEQDVSQHVRTGDSKKPSFENQSQLHNLSNQY